MRKHLLPLIAVLAAMLAVGPVVAAQTTSDDLSAAVHAGVCEDLGESVAQLDTPRPESGAWVGVEDLGVVLESDSDDVMSGQVMIDSPHSIVVFTGEDAVACGEIGGNLDDDDLYIGLQPVDDSGYFGIADLDDLDDDDDEVEIDVYIFQPSA